ncbi:MAG: response regulator transcription factor [Gammaproteobacteria bacterium]
MKKVLIADDNTMMRELLRVILKEIGSFEVIEAANGSIALDFYHLDQPDITFLDIDMPNKNGIDVLKEIKQDDPQAIVVMVSGFASMDNVKLSMDCGAKGFIVKPYTSKRVVECLQRMEE